MGKVNWAIRGSLEYHKINGFFKVTCWFSSATEDIAEPTLSSGSERSVVKGVDSSLVGENTISPRSNFSQ